MQFDIPKVDPSIIKVIGVGGGGGNAVNHMFRQGITGVDFAICNTDIQALDASPIPIRIQLGAICTEGRGAGSKPGKGKQACIESIDDVREFLAMDTKMLFVTAGMGGGTGTGAAPIIAKAAREMGILTVGIVTLPFSFEGRKRVEQGRLGMQELKDSVDSLLVISNDRLREIHGNLSMSDAFAKADDVLNTAARGIADIITVSGGVNVDFEDVNTVMRDSGVAIMGTSITEGTDRAKEAVVAALNSPLLEDNDISGARHILINISSGTNEVTMDEIAEITEYVQGEAGYDAETIWGSCHNEDLGEKLAVTIIATGFDKEMGESTMEQEAPQKIVVSLDDHIPNEVDAPLFEMGLSDRDESLTFEFEPTVARPSELSSVSELSFSEPARKAEMTARPHRRASHSPEVAPLRDARTLSEIENQPAYLRKGVVLEDMPDRSERHLSDWTITAEDEPTLKRGNPFLHDNVD